MKHVSLILCLPLTLTLALDGFGQQAASPGPTTHSTVTPYITSVSPGTLRNDFTGLVGYQITVGPDPITVMELGRWVQVGDSESHLLKIVNADGSDVPGAAVTVVMAGATEEAWSYEPLPTPVTLGAGGRYYVLSEERNGGDRFADANTRVATTDVALQLSGIYAATPSHYFEVGGPGQAYGPPNLRYLVAPDPPSVRIWTGSGPGAFWTSPDNWEPPGLLVPGDELIFPANALRRTITNDLPAGAAVARLRFLGTGYHLAGNALTVQTAIEQEPNAGSNTVALPFRLDPGAALQASAGELLITGEVETTAQPGGVWIDLTVLADARVVITGRVSESGWLRKRGEGELEFSGTTSNPAGTHLFRLEDGRLLLNKPPGTVAAPGVVLVGSAGSPYQPTLRMVQSEQVGDLQSLSLSSGLFDLNGMDETIARLDIYGGDADLGGGRLTLLNTNLIMRDGDYVTRVRGGGELRFGGEAPFGFDVQSWEPDNTPELNLEEVELVNWMGTGLEKRGRGTMVIREFHSGPIRVSNGILAVLGDARDSDVTLGDPYWGGTFATLAGTGVVGDILPVDKAALLSPGWPAGTLTCGNLTFTMLTILRLDLRSPTNSDQLRVLGSVTIEPNTWPFPVGQFQVTLTSPPEEGQIYIIIDNDGLDPVVGVFDGLSEGSKFHSGDATFRVSYAGGDGNDVTLTVLPASRTWIGVAGDGLWSNPLNWERGVAPEPGDHLIFPPTALYAMSTNDLPADFPLSELTLLGSHSRLHGNGFVLTDRLNIGSRTTVGGQDIIVAPVALGDDVILACGADPADRGKLEGALDLGGYQLTVEGLGICELGPIAGSGLLLHRSMGTLLLSSPSDFMATVVVETGILAITEDQALGSALGGTEIRDGAVLALAEGLVVSDPLVLDGELRYVSPPSSPSNSTWAGSITIPERAVVRFEQNDPRQIAFLGSINGPGTLTLDGPGQLLLCGTNEYGGQIVTNGGTLIVNGLQPLVPVFLQGQLKGTGAVGRVIASTAGLVRIDPGAETSTAATLLTGDLILSDTTTVHCDLRANGVDTLRVSGALVLDNTVLEPDFALVPPTGHVLTLIENEGDEEIIGTFLGLPEGALLNDSHGAQYQASYLGGDGNDVTLTLISAVREWTGLGSDDNWMTPENWRFSVLPQEDDDLSFPANSLRRTNHNNFPAGTRFASLIIGGGEPVAYRLMGNQLSIVERLQVLDTQRMQELQISLLLHQDLVITNAGALSSGGVIDTAGHRLVLGCAPGSLLRFDGEITGAGGLLAIGPGTAALAADNSYAGSTVISNGTLVVMAAGALGTASGDTFVAEGSTLRVDSPIAILEPLRLQGALEFVGVDNVWAGPITMLEGQLPYPFLPRLVVSGGPGEVSGVISGTADWHHMGDTLALTAENVCVGTAVCMGQGSLLIQGSYLNGPILLDDGGMAGGTGWVKSIGSGNDGGVLRPGTLNATNISLTSLDRFSVDLNGPIAGLDHGQLIAHGPVSFAGTSIVIGLGYVPPLGQQFTLVDNRSSSAIEGNLRSFRQIEIMEGDAFSIDSLAFVLSYQGGDGNDLVLTRSIPPFSISSITVLRAGRVWIRGTGVLDTAYVLESTEDLHPPQWMPVATNSVPEKGDDEFDFFIRQEPAQQQGFFRVRGL